MKSRLDWNDRAACKAFLADVTARSADVISIGEDQTSPIARRRLGRAAAVELLGEGKRALKEQLAYAARGLDVDDEPGNPSGSGSGDRRTEPDWGGGAVPAATAEPGKAPRSGTLRARRSSR